MLRKLGGDGVEEGGSLASDCAQGQMLIILVVFIVPE